MLDFKYREPESPALMPALHGSASMSHKQPASPQILDIYSHARTRLLTEQEKAERDLATSNNIQAFLHIVRSLEQAYEIPGAPLTAA